ncbi:hypothetical protein [Neisseria polysaccharea]|uniref:hypothetical protein n=1 Tax=Neisseria polysaccharea TaxID=489 RepID=UPI000E59D9E2
MVMIIAPLFDLFFDDYGLPSASAWGIYFILCCITVAFFWFYPSKEEEKVLFKFAAYSSIFVYVCFSSLLNSLNPYEYIPFIGTDIQKVNFKRCNVGKSVNLDLENIRNIMADCKKKDQELKFNADIESLAK